MPSLEQLREATRLRVNKETIEKMREHVEGLSEFGDREDSILAQGFLILIEMHDRLEALDGKS